MGFLSKYTRERKKYSSLVELPFPTALSQLCPYLPSVQSAFEGLTENAWCPSGNHSRTSGGSKKFCSRLANLMLGAMQPVSEEDIQLYHESTKGTT